MSRFERWTVGVSISSLLISIVGFALVWLQLQGANESLRTGVYANMANWTLEISKMFLANPELRPYFDGGKDISPSDPLYDKAEVVAEYLLDNMDSMLEFKSYFPGGTPHQGWTNWMYDSFDESPLLRRHIEKRRRWYEPGQLWPIYQRWKADHPSAPQPQTK